MTDIQKINPKNSVSILNSLIAFIFIIAVVLSVNFYTFPLTEGWWETYSWISNNKKIYVDFDLALPPLFTNLIHLVMEFTDQLILIRISLISVYAINLFLLIKLCAKIGNYSSAIIGVLLSQKLLMINNPVWLPKDYHSLVALLATIFSIKIYENQKNQKNINYFSLGIITGLIILTKQNIALVSILSILTLLIFAKFDSRKKLIFFLFYLIGIAILLAAYSFYFGYDWVNVYRGNDSKGSALIIFGRFLLDENSRNITLLSLLISAGYFILLNLKKTSNFKYRELIIKYAVNNSYLSNVNYKFISYALTILILYFIVIKNNSLIFYGLLVAYFFIRSYSYIIGRDEPLNALAVLLIYLAYAGTMTAGYNTVSLELLIAIFTTIVIYYISLYKIIKLNHIIILVLLMGSLAFLKNKFLKDSYNWWGYRVNSILESKYLSENPKLKHIHLDYTTNEILKSTDKLIGDLSETDIIFSYPSIPIFYWLYEKNPATRSVVQWFDVMPTDKLPQLLKDFGNNLPSIIFWLRPPEWVYTGHRSLKRSGLPMVSMDNHIIEKILSKEYLIEKVFPIGNLGFDNGESALYESQNFKPVEYEFYTNEVALDEINKKIAIGDIRGYIIENNITKIIFKNKFVGDEFIKNNKILVLNHNDWLFYILKRVK